MSLLQPTLYVVRVYCVKMYSMLCCCVTLLCLLNQTYFGGWELLRSERVGPDYDGEPQQRAGAVVHGQMVSDHLQVHHVLPGA